MWLAVLADVVYRVTRRICCIASPSPVPSGQPGGSADGMAASMSLEEVRCPGEFSNEQLKGYKQ